MKTNIKKVLLPGAVLGAFLVTGATASAFFPGNFSLDAFSDFTDSEQEAIEEAHDIMEAAREDADQVLEDAGVDREAMHEAMRTYMEENGIEGRGEGRGEGARIGQNHEEIKDSLEDGDYDAFLEVIADTPMADDMTETIFDLLVEAHQLREDGDNEGARDIMETLREDYDFGGPMHGGGHRPGQFQNNQS